MSQIAAFTLFFLGVSTRVVADLPPAIQAKVDKGLKDLAAWAADPEIVKAVKEANGKKGIEGMTNGKWEELTVKDAPVVTLLTNVTSQKMLAWGKSAGFQKLMLRDKDAYIVAASEKPLLYNNATRPQFKSPLEGTLFAAKEIKPDPTTQAKSVQIGVSVKDGETVIGVLHAGVSVD